MKKKKNILIVDDDQAMRLALAESLQSCGYDVESVENGADAFAIFAKKKFDLVVSDMRMPGMTGMEVLRGVKKMSSTVPVIMITAYGTVSTAVEAMKEGAAEFIMKPFSLDDLEAAVKNVLSKFATNPPDETESLSSRIITKDQKFISILEMLKNVAKSKSSILIQGESGTGKELVSRYIHQSSNRKNGPFVAVNCAAIPQNLLESEMFGFEKGAFTGALQKKPGKFELANTGTLLLDEISEMDVQLQAKLLRVIQESEVDRLGGSSPIAVDVRLVATTNADLSAAIRDKTFREDLYYRLNVIPVKIPPLRERNGDILYLANHFLEKFGSTNGHKKLVLSENAAAILKAYHFPGNVRELENIIERATLMTQGSSILPEALFLDDFNRSIPSHHTGQEPSASFTVPTLDATTTLRDSEKSLIFNTLDIVNGNKTQAAKILGISVRTLWNKVHEYEITESENN
jgi:DNA-binding NtrC family response regulator